MTVTTFPTRCAGPAFLQIPLQSPLLRVVLGDARHGVCPVHWVSKRSAKFNAHDNLWLECKSNFVPPDADAYESACVSVYKQMIPSKWLDFSIDSLDSLELSFCVFTTEDGFKNGKRAQQVFGSILGKELASLKGVLQRPLTDEAQRVIGTLTIDFLIVKPFIMTSDIFRQPSTSNGKLYANTNSNPNSVKCAGEHRKKNDFVVSLFTGHRGMGKTSAKRVKENTLISFLDATRNSFVDHVELDVQLTKDGYPVVYHDWFFRTHGRDKDGDASRLQVPLYNISLADFDFLYGCGLREEEFVEPSDDLLEKCLKGLTNLPEVRAYLAKDKVRTLAEVCYCLPSDLGLMVEVKYPPPNVQEEDNIVFPGHNEIVDRILHDLFRVKNNLNRSIIFLSFEADICAMLAMKQDVFPVFFSHCAGRDKPCDISDPRCVDVDQGIAFAASQNMDGILLYDDIVKQNPSVVEQAKSNGLAVITYGGNNSCAHWSAQQLNLGVDGIIADDVDCLARDTLPLLKSHVVSSARPTPTRDTYFGREFTDDIAKLDAIGAETFRDYVL